MTLTVATILTILYYLVAICTFILFRRKNITITFNNENVTKKLSKFIIIFQIVYSIAWPFTLLLIIFKR